ncbi:hypothetical protein ABVN23_28360 [Pseudomonas fluorescens]|uniref:hypothetical protein n=1 Tax=Pseudomonas fluorescens TaxID=294 RepID=UPI003F9860E8
MALTLDTHFVAFIDILGFSAMVQSDCESFAAPKYLELLYGAHVRANALFAKDLDATLIQFSDSIVLSRPFDMSELKGFLETISKWQKMLLLDGLLCRGGVTFGKHFSKDKFLFSKAMIDAYHLESAKARYPRIIISDDLLQLAKTSVALDELPLTHQDDGAAFIDFLTVDEAVSAETIVTAVSVIREKTKYESSAVQEKINWLLRYADYKFDSANAPPQFC